MRLTNFEISCITKTALRHFGKNVRVFLFGSRTIDNLCGGDIDLLISRNGRERLTAREKINFISDLILLMGEQKIDVILDNQSLNNSVFMKSIKQSGIRLC